jgi:RimJ/RimL family protein N-acetyltransferase
MHADHSVMEFFPHLLTRAESDALLDELDDHIRRHGFGYWAVEEKATGAFVGFSGFAWSDVYGTLPLMPEQANRFAASFWGRGYATEAMRACFAHAFDVLGLEAVIGVISHQNWGARRSAERAGMRLVPDMTITHPKFPAESPDQPFLIYGIVNHIPKSVASDRPDTGA